MMWNHSSQFLIKNSKKLLPLLGVIETFWIKYMFEDKDIGCANPNVEISGVVFSDHASKSEKRAHVSSLEDLWDSDINQDICNKARLITRENCLPTENLNAQIKIYKKKN
ncbi:unnamed protein product [Cuscuta epithymum]|uniref:Uncharacterized protein n=1 Tax=Cuscuta epithymum TaxID=186058 RepID=A0AAV0F7H9_9ASTE|nr:unnamed protein product [Cuscuta epithymum]